MTMVESPLFNYDPAPMPARSSDPETSKAAAASVNMRERKREVLAAMHRLDRPCTASEVQREMRRDQVIREAGTVRSRLAQLNRDGLVRKSGGVRTIPTDEGGTGRCEQLWVLA